MSLSTIIGASLSEPHIDELNVRNLLLLLLLLLWYVRHPRAAIEIVQEYAIYSNTTYGGRMKTFAFSTWLSCGVKSSAV